MNLSKQRKFISPQPDDDWTTIVARALPEEDPDTARARRELAIYR